MKDRARDLKRAKERRKLLLAKKLCQLCPVSGARPARPGRTTCVEHARENLRRQRARTKERAAKGLCDLCGLAPRTVGVLCVACVEHRKTLPSYGRNVTNESRVKAGLCRTCGERSAMAGTRCGRCGKDEAEKSRQRREERTSKGLCYRCGKHRAPAGHGCKTCVRSRRSRVRTEVKLKVVVRCQACSGVGHTRRSIRCPMWQPRAQP